MAVRFLFDFIFFVGFMSSGSAGFYINAEGVVTCFYH